MIDVVNLPVETTLECNLFDLPTSLVERIKLHLLDDEKIHFCVVVRSYSAIEVGIITPIRIVKNVVEIEKGILKFTSFKSTSRSLLLSEFIGLEQNESGPPDSILYQPVVLCRSHDLGLSFWDKEISIKFTGAILSFANQIKK